MRDQQPTPTTIKRPHASGWHPEQIKAAIRMRGRSVRQLALDSGYSDGQAIHLTLRCRHWPAVERAVADFIGVPLHELWPERYTQDDQPRPECRSRLHTGDQ